MKKLFLASFASVTLELINELLPQSDKKLKVAFIPTAAGPYENKDFVHVDRDAVIRYGMEVVDIDLESTKGEQLEKALSDVDVILVAGGNTFYLLDHVRKSGFDIIVKKLIDKGVIYIGSSAGSILCCPTIEIARRFDSPTAAPDITDYSGLNLVDFLILPHAQKEKYRDRIRETTEEMEARGFRVITLTDNQAILVDGTRVEIKQLPSSK